MRCTPIWQIARRRLRAGVVQRRNVLRIVGPAAVVKRAVPRLEAVEPDATCRERSGHDLQLLLDQARHGGQEPLHQLGHVLHHQQVAPARMPVLLVEMHDLHGADRQARPPQHPGLDGGVGDVLVLHRRGRLDLDQREAVIGAQQDVDRHEHVTGKEARLEDGRSPCVERGLGRGEALLHRGMGQVDQHPTGKLPPREFADLLALVEPVLQNLVGLQLHGIGLVDLPPEQPGALPAGDEAGLREAVHEG